MEDRNNHVFAEIEINASPEEVWRVLTDWKNLKYWSSSFIGISIDRLEKGAEFTVYFKNPLTGEKLEFERICTEYEEGVKFGWSGKVIRNVKDYHIYSLEPTKANTTIFKQEDGLHGAHSQLLNFLAEHHMTSMYKKFNFELKNTVEFLHPRK